MGRKLPNPAHENDNTQPDTIQVDESENCYEDMEGKFQNHFVPKVNIINESCIFNKHVQG